MAGPSAALLDVQTLSRMLNCSARHVYRLADAGRMPAPLRLGALGAAGDAAVGNPQRELKIGFVRAVHRAAQGVADDRPTRSKGPRTPRADQNCQRGARTGNP